MSIVSDELFGLERDLDKYPATTPDGALNRRLVLRKALEHVRSISWQEGHTDGMRDVHETRVLARDLERQP